MSRIALVATLLTAALTVGAGCSKSAANQESPTKPTGERTVGAGPGDRVAVPGASGEGVAAKGGDDTRFRLAADEGKISVEPPTDAKAGAETYAKIIVTPGDKYKVNTEFPTKITLESTTGVTLAKAELKAGGHDKAKGDADQFEEKGLAFLVKFTPSASGSYTINGSFKFAVCDKAGNQCLAKKEPIAIQLAAK